MTIDGAMNAPTEVQIYGAVEQLRTQGRTEVTGPEIYEACWPAVVERTEGARDISYISVVTTLRKLAAERRFTLAEPEAGPVRVTFPAAP